MILYTKHRQHLCLFGFINIYKTLRFFLFFKKIDKILFANIQRIQFWERSLVGRASALQAGSHLFESGRFQKQFVSLTIL